MQLKALEKSRLKESGYDLSLMQRTQPQGGITFDEFSDERFIKAGDGYIGCLYVCEFPSRANALWLTRLMNIEGTISTLDITTANKNEITSELNRSIEELRDRIGSERRQMDKDSAAAEFEELRSFAQKIVQGGEVIKKGLLRIYFYGMSLEELSRKMEYTKMELKSLKFKTVIELFQGKRSWQALFTSYDQQRKMGVSDGPVLSSDYLGGGIPFHHQSLKDPRGIYLGQTSTQGVFVFDPFHSTKARKSFNGFILGKMGFGKSTLLKIITEGLVARDCFIRGFDKARDYYDLVKSMGGKIIDLSGGEGMINPLEIYATQTDPSGRVVNEYASFMQHMAKLSNMMRFLNPGFTQVELSDFRSLVTQFYIKCGILPRDYAQNPRGMKLTGLRPEQYPIMSQLSDFLKGYKYTSATPERLRSLEKINTIVYEMAYDYGPLFNGHTSIPDLENEQILFFDIDGISRMSREVFNCQLFTALTLMWNHGLKNGRKMKLMIDEKGSTAYSDVRYFQVLIDECHNIINPNNLFAIEYIASFEREMRKFSGGVAFATQSPNEILPESASNESVDAVKTIFQLTQWKVFHNMDVGAMGRIKDALGNTLTASEYDRLPRLNEGQVLFQVASGDTYFVNIDVEESRLARYKGGQ